MSNSLLPLIYLFNDHLRNCSFTPILVVFKILCPVITLPIFKFHNIQKNPRNIEHKKLDFAFRVERR